MKKYENFDIIQTVLQPKNIDVTLYKHQLASIYNMEKFETENIVSFNTNNFKKIKIGVNADLVGYGKTLSTIGLIVRDKMLWELDIPYVFEKIKVEAEGLILTYEIFRYKKLPTNLILVSQSIISQWENEIKKTKLKYTCIKSKKDLTELQAEKYDIILVIPNMYNKLIMVYSNCAWKRFIFDEPGNLKVPGMLPIQSGFYWFLTATPEQIFHHHYRCNKGTFIRDIIGSSYTEFQNIFNNIIIKNDPEFIKASFEMPKTYHYYYDCYQPIYSLIHTFVNDNVKQLIDSGDIEGAIMSLGGDRTCNIVELILNKKKNEILELDTKIQLYLIRSDEVKINELENLKTRILNQIKDLDNKFKTMLQDMCHICYDNLKNPVLEYNCQNLFCGECILKWLTENKSCPLCRSEVDTRKLIYIKTNDDEKNNIEKKVLNMTKLETIIDIIKKNQNGKFLIFSDHDKSFMSVKTILDENEISSTQIRGNIKTLDDKINSFKNGDMQVIFLNSKYNGAGLNLQEATDIILFHEMNFNIETQILGRANRIGRRIPLNVHHLKIHNNF